MANWQRTTFRVTKKTRDRLSNLSRRSGLKQKEILDEIIKRSSRNGIWDCNPSEKIAQIYLECIDLKESERITFEISEKALTELNKISSLHSDLTRDQVLNLMVFSENFHLGFPLKKQRMALSKINPEIRNLNKIAKKIQIKVNKIFVADSEDDARGCIRWDSFINELNIMTASIEKWSATRISKNKLREISGRNI